MMSQIRVVGIQMMMTLKSSLRQSHLINQLELHWKKKKMKYEVKYIKLGSAILNKSLEPSGLW